MGKIFARIQYALFKTGMFENRELTQDRKVVENAGVEDAKKSQL
jgi:hypothetical protein